MVYYCLTEFQWADEAIDKILNMTHKTIWSYPDCAKTCVACLGAAFLDDCTKGLLALAIWLVVNVESIYLVTPNTHHGCHLSNFLTTLDYIRDSFAMQHLLKLK